MNCLPNENLLPPALSLTHSLTITHSLTHLITHALTHSHTHTHTHSLTATHSHPPTLSLTHSTLSALGHLATHASLVKCLLALNSIGVRPSHDLYCTSYALMTRGQPPLCYSTTDRSCDQQLIHYNRSCDQQLAGTVQQIM